MADYQAESETTGTEEATRVKSSSRKVSYLLGLVLILIGLGLWARGCWKEDTAEKQARLQQAQAVQAAILGSYQRAGSSRQDYIVEWNPAGCGFAAVNSPVEPTIRLEFWGERPVEGEPCAGEFVETERGATTATGTWTGLTKTSSRGYAYQGAYETDMGRKRKFTVRINPRPPLPVEAQASTEEQGAAAGHD